MTGGACHLYLVAPNDREKEAMAQLSRPAFRSDLENISFAFLPFKELNEHCDALCKFSDDRPAKNCAPAGVGLAHAVSSSPPRLPRSCCRAL